MKSFVLFISIFLSGIVLSQENKYQVSFTSFVKEYSTYLEKQPSSNSKCKVKSTLYDDRDLKKVINSDEGYLILGTDNYQYYKSTKQEVLQNETCKLVIDSSAKTVVVGAVSKELFTGSVTDYLKNADSTQYRFHKWSDKNAVYFKITELFPVSTNQESVFVFDLKTMKMVKVEFTFWPRNYFSASLDDETLEQPFFVTIYSDYGAAQSSNEWIDKRISEWILTTESGKQLTEQKKDFQLYDLLSNPSRN